MSVIALIITLGNHRSFVMVDQCLCSNGWNNKKNYQRGSINNRNNVVINCIWSSSIKSYWKFSSPTSLINKL
jgi:hypothetical protein